MRARSLATLTLLLAAVAVTGCDSNDEENEATVTGTVLNADTNAPVAGALVRISGEGRSKLVQTDSAGDYSYVFDLADVAQSEDGDASATLNIEAFADGFQDGADGSRVSVEVFGGRTREVPAIRLLPIGSTGTPADPNDPNDPNDPQPSGVSGPARSVTLASRSAEAITVAGAGGTNEVALLTFVVYDAQGRPVNTENAVDVAFDITTPQSGGVPEAATLSTNRETTNAAGEAFVYLTSGTQAQTVQVRASFTTAAGETVTSSPVAVVIRGGLPAAENFSLAASAPNFAPAFSVAGLTQQVTAYVGDRYGNPVVEGTTVYFSTNGGQIEGAGVTDALGRASVTLLSTAEVPINDGRGPGFVTVEANTIGEGGQRITETGSILFSGASFVQVTRREYIAISDTSGYYEVDFTVSDANGNPLGPNTQITVSAQGENVDVAGSRFGYSGNVQVGGPGITTFSTEVRTQNYEEDAYLASVTIDVSSPNGGTQRAIGVGRVLNEVPEPEPEPEPEPQP